MILKMWDRSSPPKTFPDGYHAAAGYVGGDTPTPWSRTDWGRVGQAGLRALPIWVRSNPAGHTEGLDDGTRFAEALGLLGVPDGCPVVLDRETSVDYSYVQAFTFELGRWGRTRLVEYGSDENLFVGAGQPYGYWPADPTGYLHWNPVDWPGHTTWPPGVHAVQCIWANVDTSVIGGRFYDLLWQPSAALAAEEVAS